MSYRQACYRAWMRVLTRGDCRPHPHRAIRFNLAQSMRCWLKMRKEAFPWA